MNAVQSKIIARLDMQWSQIVMLQEHHLKYWGHYCQGLASHDHLPNGVVAEKINAESRPIDQATSYMDFWRGKYWVEEGEGLEVQRVDKYRYPVEVIDPLLHLAVRIFFNVSCGPSGKDWSIVLEYRDATTSEHWRYTRQSNGFSQGWLLVPKEEAV